MPNPVDFFDIELKPLYDAMPYLMSLEHDIEAGSGLKATKIMVPLKHKPKEFEDSDSIKFLGYPVVWGEHFALIYEPIGIPHE